MFGGQLLTTDMKLRQTTWFIFSLKGGPHSSYDIVTAGPRPVHELGEQPTFARSD
jgi:hypothetical protein